MMLAPGSSNNNGIVDNKKAKRVTFTKKKGRISLMMGDKNVGGSNMVVDRIQEMKSEVDHAQAGSTVTTMKDVGPGGPAFKRHGIKSTFPKWFGETGFNSKKDFMKVLNNKKGVRYDRLVNRAVSDLSSGYDTSFGRVPSSEKFQVASRQKFDNRGVTFRFIKGKVRPLRGGNVVPF